MTDKGELEMRDFIAILVVFALAAVVLAGCSDTTMASLSALGTPGHITCWKGDGAVILDTESTGKIMTVEHSDGWEFKDSKDNRFVRVTGTCVIRN